MSQEIRDAIQLQARELLGLGEVRCVVGHERSPKGHVRPTFIYDEVDAGRLTWDQTCRHNLTVYLRELVGSGLTAKDVARVAIVARPCDVRALNVLIHEGQVKREQVFVIGVACPGMLESAPLSSPPHDTEPGALAAHCRRCRERVPVFYDVLAGKPPKVDLPEETWSDVAELEAMPPAERLAYWAREFEHCIRCYACRQACPGCYCFECLAEQVDPPWVSIAHGVPQKAFFHIMRAYHLAGRCVECHACEEACPMHIPLSLLNRKIAREVKALFGYVAGGDPDTAPPLATFRRDEDLPL